jgi:hypothetical protein
MLRQTRCSKASSVTRMPAAWFALALWVLFGLALPESAQAGSLVQYIPLVGPESGVQTRIDLTNPLDTQVQVTLYGYARDDGGRSPIGDPIELGPRGTRVLEAHEIPFLCAFGQIESSGPILAAATLTADTGSKSETIPAALPSRQPDFVFFSGSEAEASVLYLINPSESSAAMELSLFGRSGQKLASGTASIPSGGHSLLVLREMFGISALGKARSLRIRSTEPISGFRMTHRTDRDFVGLPAQTQAAMSWWFATPVKLGTVKVRSVVEILNSGSAPANLVFEAFDSRGGSLGSSGTVLLNPGGTYLLSQKASGVLPTGAASLRVSSDQPVKGAQLFTAQGGGLAAMVGRAGSEPSALEVKLSGDQSGRVLSARLATASAQSQAATITVTAPAASSVLQAGQAATIAWGNSSRAGTYVSLALYKGGVWQQTFASGVWINTHSFDWVVDYSVPKGSDYKVQVLSDTGIVGWTPRFSILDSTISVLSPDGLERWQIGTTQKVRWKFEGDPGQTVTIDLLKGGGWAGTLAWGVPVGSTNTHQGSWLWTIPVNLEPGKDYKIRVTSDGGISGQSKSNFFLTPSGVTVTEPSVEKIEWRRGTVGNIRWTFKENTGSSVNIDLFKGGGWAGTIAENVAIGTSGKGSYGWVIPSAIGTGTDYKIRVKTDKGLEDSSDYDFAIMGQGVALQGPGTWTDGGPYAASREIDITWTFQPYAGTYVDLELFKGGGWVGSIAWGIPIGSGGQGKYPWIIYCLTTPGTDYRVRVRTDLGFEDYSDYDFAILSHGLAVDYISSMYKTENTMLVGWHSSNSEENIGDYVNIDLFKGGAWQGTIGWGLWVKQGGSGFTWMIPASITEGSDYQVRVRTDWGVEAFSGNFTIYTP